MTGGLFSKREITSQLEIALQEHREVEFEGHEKEDYLILPLILMAVEMRTLIFGG